MHFASVRVLVASCEDPESDLDLYHDLKPSVSLLPVPKKLSLRGQTLRGPSPAAQRGQVRNTEAHSSILTALSTSVSCYICLSPVRSNISVG